MPGLDVGPMTIPVQGVKTPDDILRMWNNGEIDVATATQFLRAMGAPGLGAPMTVGSAQPSSYTPPSAPVIPQAPTVPAGDNYASATLDQIRAANPAWKDATDTELVNRIAQVTHQDPYAVMYDHGVAPPNDPGFMTSVKGGLYGLAGGVGAVVQDASGYAGLSKWARQGEENNPSDMLAGPGDALSNLGHNLARHPFHVGAQLLGSALSFFGPALGAELLTDGGATAVLAPSLARMGLTAEGISTAVQASRLADGAVDAASLTRAGYSAEDAGKILEATKVVRSVRNAAKAVTGTAVMAAPSYGDIREQQRALGENSGGDIARAGLAAVGIGAAQHFLGAYPAISGGDVIPGVAARGGNILSTMGRTALGAAAQAPIQTYGEAWAENKNLADPKLAYAAGANAAVQALTGAALGPWAHFTGAPKALADELRSQPGAETQAPADQTQAPADQTQAPPVGAQAPSTEAGATPTPIVPPVEPQPEAAAPAAPAIPDHITQTREAISRAVQGENGDKVLTATKTVKQVTALADKFATMSPDDLEAFADKSRSPAQRSIAQHLADIRRENDQAAPTTQTPETTAQATPEQPAPGVDQQQAAAAVPPPATPAPTAINPAAAHPAVEITNSDHPSPVPLEGETTSTAPGQTTSTAPTDVKSQEASGAEVSGATMAGGGGGATPDEAAALATQPSRDDQVNQAALDVHEASTALADPRLEGLSKSQRGYVRAMLEDPDITQQQLADRLGLTQGRVSQIKGEVQTALSAKLGMGIDEFRQTLRTAAVARTAGHDELAHGLSPDQQEQRLDVSDLRAGGDEGDDGGYAYTEIDSPNQSRVNEDTQTARDTREANAWAESQGLDLKDESPVERFQNALEQVNPNLAEHAAQEQTRGVLDDEAQDKGFNVDPERLQEAVDEFGRLNRASGVNRDFWSLLPENQVRWYRAFEAWDTQMAGTSDQLYAAIHKRIHDESDAADKPTAPVDPDRAERVGGDAPRVLRVAGRKPDGSAGQRVDAAAGEVPARGAQHPPESDADERLALGGETQADGADRVDGRPGDAADSEQAAADRGAAPATGTEGRAAFSVAADRTGSDAEAQPAANPRHQAAETLTGRLSQAFGSPERMAKKVTVVQSADDPRIPADARAQLEAQQSRNNGRVQAITHNGKVYMIADHIPEGREMGVLLHEVGVHLGMRGLLGDARLQALAGKIHEWAGKNDSSLESRIAQAVQRRMEDAGTTDPEERVAYFVEEALNHGVDPTAMKAKDVGPVHQWIRSIWAAFKAAVRKLGVTRIDKLTGQDVVDMAYGAARLEIAGESGDTGGEGPAKFSFAGRKANIAGQAQLGEALDRLQRGDDPEQVRDETGWHIGTDGEPRFEIHDHMAELTEAMDQLKPGDKAKLGDVLSHPRLFSAYPFLKDLKVTRDPDPGSRGWYYKGSINVSPGLSPHDTLSVLLHEVQHAVQEHEGFARGANPDESKLGDPEHLRKFVNSALVSKDKAFAGEHHQLAAQAVQHLLDSPHALATAKMFQDEIDSYPAKAKTARDELDARVNAATTGKEIAAANKAYNQKLAALQQDREDARMQLESMYDGAGKQFAPTAFGDKGTYGSMAGVAKDALYRLSAGETESRLVQSRMHYGAMGRVIALRPDVSPENQIVVRGTAQSLARSMDGVDPHDVVPEGTKVDPERAAKHFDAIDRMVDAATRRMPEPVRAAVGQVADTVHEALTQGAKRLARNFMTMRDIVKAYGHIDGVQAHARAIFESGSTAHREQLKYARVHDAMMRLPIKTRLQLGTVMEVAKRLQVHVDQPLESTGNKHLEGNQETYDAANREWVKLGQMKDGAAAQTIYKQARDVLRYNYLERKQLLTVKAKELGVDMPPMLERNGPYFPSSRDDEPYVVTWKSPELQGAAPGSKAEAALKTNPDHYVVSFEPTQRSAARLVKQLEAEGKTGATWKERTKYERELSGVPKAFLDKLEQVMQDSNADAETIKTVRDLYLQSLPAAHSVTQQMTYRGVAGIRPAEMIHGFAKAAMSDSFHLASLKHSDQIVNTLEQVKRADSGQQIYNVLRKRYGMLTKSSRNVLASKLSSFTYMNMLGANPAFLSTQMAQPWMLALPQLAAKDGVGLRNATSQMGRGMSDAMKVLKLLVHENGWRYELSDEAFQRAGVNGGERDLLNSMLDQGLLDMTGSMDFSGAEPGLPAASGWLMKAGTIAPHMIEQLDRMGVALATYRSLLRAGKSVEQATEAAHDIVAYSMFDYSRENTAYAMMPGHMGGWNRLFMQFRKYQQGVIATLVRNIAGAARGDKEAMRATFGLLATHMLMAGAAGLPLAFPVATLAKMVTLAWPGQDAPDFDQMYREFLNDTLGSEGALAFEKGIPSLLGVDLSQRMGAGDVFSPVPYTKWAGSFSDTYKDFLAGGVAPVLGTVSNTMRGFDDMSQGQMAKGFGQILPKFVANFAKAYALSEHGITTKYGNQAVRPDQISPADTAITALGFTPTKVGQYYDAASRVGAARQDMKDARDALISRWVNARMDGNASAAGSVQQDIAAFNAKRIGLQSTERITTSELMRSLQRQRLGSSQVSNGVTLGRRERWLAPYAR